ncbi:RyR domain-containing protein [Pantoea sp. MBD-2R]|uniref:RyR domain-containing protein n=1 Tax=Pantoea sp. MBD-2R TaxID=3141540 RepID=UPI0031844113
MDKLLIAKIAHNVNRAFCQSIGDDTQSTWGNAPQWQKDSALLGVDFHLSGDRSPADSHNSWLAQKKTDGWKYGPEKDVAKKEHPCFIPYEELPLEQRTKDYLFKAVVDSFKV